MRKYGQTLPDSVLPPPEVQGAAAPRMSTPSNDNTWTGWAISSFTNKFATASGEMQPNKNGVESPPISRPTSVPPASNGTKASRLGTGQNRLVPTRSSPVVPRVTSSVPVSPQPEEEDFGDDWGAMDEEEVADAWDAPAVAKTVSSPKASAPAVAYDDQGEPDFEGWLNAQAQAKKKPNKPLPKGLAKKTSAPVAASRVSPAAKAAAQNAAAKMASKPSPTPAPVEDDGEAWGDAWD